LLRKSVRTLREELAFENTRAIKETNAELISFESSQRLNADHLRRMSSEELIREVEKLRKEVMSLKQNQVFLSKNAA
jgi:hypothetical protein